MNRVARLGLLAYPKSFRRQYGAEWTRTVTDLRTHGGLGRIRLVARVAADVLVTAPRMRWENLMKSSRLVLTVIVAVAAACAALFVAPFAALPLIVIGAVLYVQATRHDRPVAAETYRWARRWYLWLAVAAGLFLVGFSMLVTSEDGALGTAAWATWVLSWLAAAIAAAVGVSLGAARDAQLRRS